jgi:1,4-alpha-glucan branching enzyme
LYYGYLCLVLHAHLPFVRHPYQRYVLEEDWFYEALTETYIPLIILLEKWEYENIPYRLTISITPTLAAMMEDELLCHRYREYLGNLQDLAVSEIKRTHDQPSVHRLAEMYAQRYNQTAQVWDRYSGRLINAFKSFQNKGNLEILASAATHCYLPLYNAQPEMVQAQIKIGCESYRRTFEKDPVGFWLPECGFLPGQDQYLCQEGIKYTFVDSHGLLHASKRPRYGVYAPVISDHGVAFFARDGESSKQVWSADEGYPGDFDYREFYRDIGWDLDWNYIYPFLKHGLRANTGIKYHRITGKTNHKELYDRDRAVSKAYLHAGNFIFNRERQVEYLHGVMDRPPVVVSPYDAELFGHWWFEGPDFLDGVIRRASQTPVIKLITPSEYLNLHPRNQQTMPSQSSWGLKGYSEVWLEGSNDWIYRHLHIAADKMLRMVKEYTFSAESRRVVNQAAKELLLAQSSDWPFIMKTGTMTSYAQNRIKEHLSSFLRLERMLQEGSIDYEFLNRRENTTTIFPWLDATNYYHLDYKAREALGVS